MPLSLTVTVLFHGLLWAVACSAAGETGRTAIVGTAPGQVSLLAALQDQDVQTIHLAGEYHVADEFEAFVGSPVKLTRNVTLMGQPGQPEPVLDLDFANSVVELCSSCVFTLRNITVKNERRGTGPYFDIFVGQPGSRVKPFHAHRWHLVCTSASESAETIRSLPRSPLMPRPDSPQALTIANVTFQGKLYPNSLRYDDVTFDVPRQHQEGRGWGGGYALGCTGGIRICDHYVTQQCLIDNTPDYCVTKMTDAIMAGAKQPSSDGGGSSSGLNPAVLAAAVAVPIVVVAALAALALLLLRRKRRRQIVAKGADTPPHSAQWASMDQGHRTHGPHRDSASMHLSRHPAGFGQGWQLSSSLTSPLVGPVDDTTIEFGEMLGSGSFGRVFAARWAGRDVAVKVIEHSTETVAAVESEMQLMLSFNNDNIVRAYHCATYTRASTAATGSEYSSNSMLHTQPSLPREPSIARTHSHLSQMPAGAIGVAGAAAAGAGGVASPPAALRNGSFDSSGRPTQDGSARITPRGGQRWPSHGEPPQVTPPQQQVRIAACGDTSTGGSCTTGGSFPLHTSTKSSKGSASKAADNSKRAETHLVEEYCDSGTLTNYMAQFSVRSRSAIDAQQEHQGPAGPMSEEVLLRLLLLLKDAASGLACLHANHVVHGDLNGRNVLVASNSKADLGVTAKVADLGLSRVIKHHETHRTTNTVGTMSHMPPELLRYGRMSPAVDIYAFGVMMWELYTSQPAFRKLQYGQFFETVVLRNLRPMIPQGMPADYQLLMEHCWATDPECRPNVERLLECLRFMIQERADRQNSQPLVNLQHSKSAPSPMSLLKPLPDKRKTGATGLGAGDESGAAAARGASGCSNESVGAGPQSGRIHSSFSGLIVGSDFGEAGVLDTSAAADRSAHGGNHSGPVVLDAQQLAAAVNRRAAAQQENAQQFYAHPSSGYLGSPGSLSATPAAGCGLPPRLAPRPPPAANNNRNNNQPPWAPEQEQAWCI